MLENILSGKARKEVAGKREKCRVCEKVKKFKKFRLPIIGERATRKMCLKCYLAIKKASIVDRRKIIPISQDFS